MTNATLWIRPLQRRMFSKREAAEYLGIPLNRFEGLGIAPVEVVRGVLTYDVQDLDARIELIKIGSGDADDDVLGKLG